MATLITRADGNFTTAGTWGTVASGGSGVNSLYCQPITANGTVTIAANTTQSSAAIVPAATALDGIAIYISSITAMTGNLTLKLTNTTSPGNREASVVIDSSAIPTNMRGWLLVSFASVTPNGADSYTFDITRAAGATGTFIVVRSTAVNSDFARLLRTTTTAAPAAANQLLMCGEYTGSTTVNLRTVTMDNTATTTFGDLVATFTDAIFLGDKATLDWATTASTNFYLRFKGIFRICARGILQMYTASSGAGSLPSTSTAVLEMDCTAAGDSAVQIGGNTALLTGGTWTLNGQVRGTSGTITGATNATPIVITDVAHGYDTGAGVVISGVTGNTAANGTWWITKIDADSYSLDNSAGNAAYVSGGTRISRLASKMATTTTIGTDTISIGSLITSSGTAIQWVEGQKFDTGWSGIVTINGTTNTISGSPTTTTMNVNSSTGTISAGTPGTLIKLGTGAPVTMKLGDTSFLAANDIIGCGVSSNRVADAGIGIVSTVDSATQVTLKGPPCEYIVSATNGSTAVTLAKGQTFPSGSWTSVGATIDGNAVTISSNTAFGITLSGNYAGTTNSVARLQITGAGKTQNSIYMSGLNDANGDVRAEAFLLTRNVMVRSLGQDGNSAGLFGLINLGSTDGVVNWNYGEFSLLGSGSGTAAGIHNLISTGTFSMTFCTVRDFWGTSATVNLLSFSPTNAYTLNNNFFSNLQIAGTSGTTVHTVNGNIFFTTNNIANGSTMSAIWNCSYNTWICTTTCLICGQPNPGKIGTWSYNTIHACGTWWRDSIAGFYGEFKKTIYWRNTGTILNMTGSSLSTNNYIIFSNLIAYGNSQSAFLGSGYPVILDSPILDAGAIVVSPAAFVLAQTGGGVITIYNGQIGLNQPFATGATITNPITISIISYNTSWSVTNMITSGNLSLGSSVVSIKHNSVVGDNRSWVPMGAILPTTPAFSTDTTIYNNTSPSLRCYPASATFKIQAGPFYIPVRSGVNPTISVRVRKSVVGDGTAYNGNQPRLVLLASSVLGFSYDTTLGYNLYSAILATASGAAGSWETLTATLPTAPTDDGVVLVVVDLDGTTGWVNIDDIYVDSPNTSGTKYWGGDFAGPMMISTPDPITVKRRRRPR